MTDLHEIDTPVIDQSSAELEASQEPLAPEITESLGSSALSNFGQDLNVPELEDKSLKHLDYLAIDGYSALFMKGVSMLDLDLAGERVANWEFSFRDREDTKEAFDKALSILNTLPNATDVADDLPFTPEDVEANSVRSLLALAFMAQVGLRRGYFVAYESGTITKDLSKSERWKQKGDRLNAPHDAKRRAVEVKETDLEEILQSPEDIKQAVLAELTDVYRRNPRNGVDKSGDWHAIQTILTSMEPSWIKSLLAIQGFRYFNHPSNNQPELAEQALQHVGNEHIAIAVRHAFEKSQESAPSKVIDRISKISTENLNILLSGIGGYEISVLEENKEDALKNARITVNLPIGTLMKVLFDSFKLYSMAEAGRSGGSESVSISHRHRIEHNIGVSPENETFVERPVYGAMALSDDEKAIGPRRTQMYGDSVITVKPDVMRDRTAYLYGDSLNSVSLFSSHSMSEKPMVFEDAVTAKMIYENRHPNGEINPAGKHYVEALVLGGINLADIESVTIPLTAIIGEEGGKRIGFLRAISDEYPDLSLKLSATPEEAAELFDDELEWFAERKIDIVLISRSAEEWRMN